VANLVNLALLAVSLLALAWRMVVMRRPFAIESKETWRGLLTAPVAMVVYAVVLSAWPVVPLGLYLFGAGAAVGGLLGLVTRVKVEGETAIGRRAWFYLVLWTAVYLLTQWLGTALGDGGVSAGLTLMLLPLGMGAAQDLMLLAKAGAAAKRAGREGPGAVASVAALGVALVIVLNVLLVLPCRAQTPLKDVRFPGDDWTAAACIEYNRGQYHAALDLALTGERYYGEILPGEWKARSQVVASMAAGNLDDQRAAGLLASAQATLTDVLRKQGYPESEIAGRVAAAISRLKREINAVRPADYELRRLDVVYIAPYGAVYRQDIPLLWERYGHLLKDYLDYPGVAQLLSVLMPLIQVIGDGKPIAPERAAAAGAVVPAVVLASTVLDFRLISQLARRRQLAGAPRGAAGKAPSVQLAEFDRLAGRLQSQMKAAAGAGADLPLSLTEWRPDRPAWLNWVRQAVEKYLEYEDQIEAAGEVRELVGEVTQADEFGTIALSRLMAVVAFLQSRGLVAEAWGERIDELAAKSGAGTIKDLLKAVDDAGRDPEAVLAALTGATGGDPPG